MAAQMKFAEYDVGTSRVSLTDALGLSERIFINTLSVRANKDNSGIIYHGGSDVTDSANRGGYMEATEGYMIDMDRAFFSSDDLYFIADAASQTLHLWWAA
jgi:hypothetical protein